MIVFLAVLLKVVVKKNLLVLMNLQQTFWRGSVVVQGSYVLIYCIFCLGNLSVKTFLMGFFNAPFSLALILILCSFANKFTFKIFNVHFK